MPKLSTLVLATALCLSPATAYAQNSSQASAAAAHAASQDASSTRAGQPRIPTGELLKAVAQKTGQRYVVEERVPTTLATGTLSAEEITESDFLHILSLNGIAAVRRDDLVTIVPYTNMRQYALPLVEQGEQGVLDAEWVTHVVRPNVETPAALVPVLRPMLSQAAHLAVYPETGAMIIVERWENVRRLVAVIRAIEASE